MGHKLWEILLVSTIITCSLQIESRHHEYYSSYDNPYYYQNTRSSSASDVDDAATVIAVIIIVGFCVCAGVACYCCCKALRARSSNTREYVGQPPPNQFAPPQNINQYPYPQPPPYYQGINQPLQVGRPANLSSPANPIIEQIRLDVPCDSCSLKYRQGE
jgi:hypothetical protein